MISMVVLESARKQYGAAGRALAAEMREFLPSSWPPHRYDPLTVPEGVFEQSSVARSAPNFPGFNTTVPDWDDAPGADPYGFALDEANKNSDFVNWLFTRKDVAWLADYFAFSPGEIISTFGSRADRSFESGKFPRDEWKAGSVDVDAWNAARNAIARVASEILIELEQLANENAVLAPRSWLITKFVQGEAPDVSDVTFATMPQNLEDVAPDWLDFPAYLRIADNFDGGDPAWDGSGAAYAWAANRYDLLFQRLESGAFAQDFFDSCITLWRTGSQTRRRDQYT